MISYGDITAFRRVERDLREGEERFRRLSSATREGVLVHNGDVIIDANDAALALLDRSLAELVGRSAERLIDSADYAALRDTFECGKTKHHEAWFLRPDGSRFLCEVSQRLVSCRGRTAGVLTFYDITGYRWIEDQLRWARQQAEAESRSNSDFLAVMSQGLRAPLGRILGTIHQLSESQLTDEQRGRLQTVRKSVEGMIGTLGDVQDLARIEGGRQRIDDDAFDLIDLVESVVGPLAAQATAKGIDLVSSVAADVPRAVRGDAGRLRQVLTTLIDNAVKFTSHGGVSLSLTASPTDDGTTTTELRFEVADTGIGIDPAAHTGIFDGDAGGMGLVIANRLVELMGGGIGFDSAPDIGSHFWFSVTLERREEKSSDAGGRDFSGTRVLLVEGNGASRKALARQLAAWNATVHAVPDGAAALAAAEETDHHAQFDTALIDSQDADLPVSTIAQRLRDAGVGRLILLCPPGPPPVEWHRLEAAGFSSVLHKPARQAMLAAALSGERIVETGPPGMNADAPEPDQAAPAKDAPKLAGTTVPDNTRAGSAQAGSAQAGSGRRLLLVEDSVTNQLVASTLLKIAGYRVDIASNGVEAVNAVKATPFDLVLMDIAMPEMDGIAATKAIRALPAPACRTPIIAMTANAMVGDRERFLDAGMNDYVPKPIERPYLLATIARWLPALPAAFNQPSGVSTSTAAIPVAPVNEPQKDDVLDIAVLEQLKHDLDEVVLPDLIDAFVSEARQRSRRMAEAAATGNLAIIEREAHTLKSSAGTFGAARLMRAVQTMERTCRGTDKAAVERLSGVILSLVEEAADAYRALGLNSAPATQIAVMTPVMTQ
jgi:PAS domain S-box-containing protein